MCHRLRYFSFLFWLVIILLIGCASTSTVKSNLGGPATVGYVIAQLYDNQARPIGLLRKTSSRNEMRMIVELIGEPTNSLVRDVVEKELKKASFALITVINDQVYSAEIKNYLEEILISVKLIPNAVITFPQLGLEFKAR